jgi:hypothetical protein
MWSDPAPTALDQFCFFACTDAGLGRLNALLDDPSNDAQPYSCKLCLGSSSGSILISPASTLGTTLLSTGVLAIYDAYERLLDCGAQARNSVKDVGGDIRVASVADPFGNVIGVIQDPHFRVKE